LIKIGGKIINLKKLNLLIKKFFLFKKYINSKYMFIYFIIIIIKIVFWFYLILTLYYLEKIFWFLFLKKNKKY